MILKWEGPCVGNVVRVSGEWKITSFLKDTSTGIQVRYALWRNGELYTERKNVDDCEDDAQSVIDGEAIPPIVTAPTVAPSRLEWSTKDMYVWNSVGNRFRIEFDLGDGMYKVWYRQERVGRDDYGTIEEAKNYAQFLDDAMKGATNG